MSNEIQIDCKVHITAQFLNPPEDNQQQIVRNSLQLKLDELAHQEQERLHDIMELMAKALEAGDGDVL